MFAAIAALQCFIINSMAMEETEFGFSTMYTAAGTDSGIIQRVLFSYLPIPFILFLAEDVIEDLVKGYNLMIIVRNYNRSLLFAKIMAKVVVITVLSVAFIVVLSLLFGTNSIHLDVARKVNIVVFYSLVLLNTIAFDVILALILHKKQVSNIFINIFFVVSLLLPVKGGNIVVNCIFFPKLAFAAVNGATGGIDSNPIYLQLYLLVCFMVICLMGQKKYKDMDIY